MAHPTDTCTFLARAILVLNILEQNVYSIKTLAKLLYTLINSNQRLFFVAPTTDSSTVSQHVFNRRTPGFLLKHPLIVSQQVT